MKLKYALMNGLFMSAAFAACTNDEIVDMQNVQNMDAAISLGENFTITGNLGLDSRAIYNDQTSGSSVSIKSLWEPNDSVGGAWYAALTAKQNGDTPAQGFLFNGGVFASNHPFTREDNEGNVALAEFSTLTNAFAGKYVLYYPYDATVAATAANIPVKMETAQIMDIANPMAHVNENMFVYTNAEYVDGGNQAEDFSLQAVPVLYRLRFNANADTRALVGKTISKVVIESASLYKDGKIVVGSEGSVNAYCNAVGQYVGNTTTGLYTLEMVGNEDEADYKISAVGTATAKPFYISVLPANEEIAALTIKVVTSDGLVFQKTISNLQSETNDAVREALTSEGGLFAYTITLDEEGAEDGAVYTNEQFLQAWEAAQEDAADENSAIVLGAPLSFEELEMNATSKNITISGMKLTVGELTVTDGELSINDLEGTTVTVGQYGTLTTTSAKIGDLTVVGGGIATLSGVTEIATINVERGGALTVNGAAASTSKVTSNVTAALGSEVTFNNISLKGTNNLSGAVEVNGTVAFNGQTTLQSKAVLTENASLTKVTFDNLTVNGTLTASQTTVFKALTNNGIINITGAATTFEGSAVNSATAEGKGINITAAVTNKSTFTNRGNLNINAVFTNNEGKTLNLEVSPIFGASGSISNSGTLNVKVADVEEDAENEIEAAPANLKVANNAKGSVEVNMSISDSKVTFESLSNAGIVNINKGIVLEKAANAITMNGEKAAINVAENAELKLYTGHTAFAGGNIVVVDGSRVIGVVEEDPIACIGTTIPEATINDGAQTPTEIAINTMILNAATTVTSSNASTIASYNLVLRANLTLKADLGMTTKKVYVQEEILLTGAAATQGDVTPKTLSVDAAEQITVSSNKLFKIGSMAEISKTSGSWATAIVNVGGTIN